MSRIALALSAVMLVRLEAAPPTGGPPVIDRPYAKPGRPLAFVKRLPAEADYSPVCKVIWHPDPTGSNPFGFIPTECTTRAQLLPLTWEMQTIFATAQRDRLVVRPKE